MLHLMRVPDASAKELQENILQSGTMILREESDLPTLKALVAVWKVQLATASANIASNI